jgi:hypothetical protein
VREKKRSFELEESDGSENGEPSNVKEEVRQSRDTLNGRPVFWGHERVQPRE